jgi:pimeloyl-ACP methyl ester carboxylesterase
MAGETPTIVLVHGAWADATGFDAEIRALRDRGFSVVGFGNPLRDLAGDAAYLAEFLGTMCGPIVLVGHSYGGNVISAAAIGNEQVQALVYFNGWMCDVGESQQQLLEKFESSLVGPSIRPVPFTNPDGSEGIDLYLAPEAFREAFAADVDPVTAAVMAAAQRPYAAAAFAATPSVAPAWMTLPCWYLLVPRTGRSHRRSSGSWPSARTRRLRRWRLRTSRSCPSLKPRPNSSDRPSRRPPLPAEQRSPRTSRVPGAATREPGATVTK